MEGRRQLANKNDALVSRVGTQVHALAVIHENKGTGAGCQGKEARIHWGHVEAQTSVAFRVEVSSRQSWAGHKEGEGLLNLTPFPSVTMLLPHLSLVLLIVCQLLVDYLFVQKLLAVPGFHAPSLGVPGEKIKCRSHLLCLTSGQSSGDPTWWSSRGPEPK